MIKAANFFRKYTYKLIMNNNINNPKYLLYHHLINPFKRYLKEMSFYVFRLFPLQNKVIASTFKGMKYGDNPQFIFEQLRLLDDKIDFVWLKREGYTYDVPSWIRVVSWNMTYKLIYELATAKVIIDTHRFRKFVRKRKGQVFMETWHGGVPIKKLETDVPKFCVNKTVVDEIETTNRVADVYISQSDLLSSIYRRAFKYEGPIWKCGYPRNDVLFSDNSEISKKICQTYNIQDKHIVLYAPSFRDYFYKEIDVSVYSVDFAKLKETLAKRFGGEWVIMTRWHPLFASKIAQEVNLPSYVIDATTYPDIQDLLMTVNVVVSDYSSCMFDAALRNIPCFIYATDVEQYRSDRGMYFEMEELPFTYASNNEELTQNILNYNEQDYQLSLKRFFDRIGLVETGHAGKDIAKRIKEHMDGKHIDWKVS